MKKLLLLVLCFIAFKITTFSQEVANPSIGSATSGATIVQGKLYVKKLFYLGRYASIDVVPTPTQGGAIVFITDSVSTTAFLWTGTEWIKWLKHEDIVGSFVDSIYVRNDSAFYRQNTEEVFYAYLKQTLYVVTPLHALNDSTWYIAQASATDSGYLIMEDWIRFNHKVDSIYVENDGGSVDSFFYDNGESTRVPFYVNDVQADAWIVAPSVNYTGIPYTYDITAGVMRMGGRRINILPTRVVLDSSESDPRIDVFYSDSSGHSSVSKGTSDPNPVKPQVDETWQREITFLQIPGGVGQTPELDTSFIYKNNAEGWNVSLPSGLTVDSANTIPGTVYEGTKSVNVSGTVNSSNYRFSRVAPFDLSPYTSITLYIKLKAPLTGNNNIAIRWLNGTSAVSTLINLTLARNNISSYQPVNVNLTQFGLTTNIVTALQVYSNGTTVSPYPGYYLDYAYLQRGIPVLPAIIPVTSISSYNTAQDTIKYVTADGINHIFPYKASAPIPTLDQVLASGSSISVDRSITTSTHQLNISGSSGAFGVSYTNGSNVGNLTSNASIVQMAQTFSGTTSSVIAVTSGLGRLTTTDGTNTSTLGVKPDSITFNSSHGLYKYYSVSAGTGTDSVVTIDANGVIHKRNASLFTPVTPTWQQVFNTQVGGAVLTKTDSVQIGVNSLKFFGTGNNLVNIIQQTNANALNVSSQGNGVVSITSGYGFGVYGSSIGTGVAGLRSSGDNLHTCCSFPGIFELSNPVNDDTTLDVLWLNRANSIHPGAGSSINFSLGSLGGSGGQIGYNLVDSSTLESEMRVAVYDGTFPTGNKIRAKINRYGIKVPNGIMQTSGSGGTDSAIFRNSSTGQFYLAPSGSGYTPTTPTWQQTLTAGSLIGIPDTIKIQGSGQLWFDGTSGNNQEIWFRSRQAGNGYSSLFLSQLNMQLLTIDSSNGRASQINLQGGTVDISEGVAGVNTHGRIVINSNGLSLNSISNGPLNIYQTQRQPDTTGFDLLAINYLTGEVQRVTPYGVGGGGTTPDLQAVTDVGNTTTNDITSAGTVTGAYVFGTQIESPDFISDGLFELQTQTSDGAHAFFQVGGLYKTSISGYSARSILFLHDTTSTLANVSKGAYVMALPNVSNIDTLYMPDHGGQDTLATLSDIRGGISGSGAITGTTDNLLKVTGANLNTNKTFSVLTYSSTPTWDLTTGYNKTITLTGDPVISFSNAQSGDAISLIVAQDGTGGHLLTIGSNALTINPTASSSTVVGCIYNGTVWSCASGYSTNSGTNTGDVTLAGGSQTYLTIAGQVITANAVNLSGTHVTGTLAAARFGALTGDVTNSAGSYATTIANSAITNAKVSASAAITLSKLAITGTPDGTKFLRDDATWQTVTSGFASPMTTLGDIIYEDATPAAARLAGNTTTTKKFLRQTGNGTISAVPAWDVLVAGDVPDLSGTYQPLDADLTTIAGLTATTNNFLVSVSSAWASRTPAQVKTTLSLDNVDNTSDATKNSASVTLTNKTITAPVISSITNTGTLTLPTVTGTVMQYAEATTASNATWAPAGDARVNWYQLTAQAVTVTTISAPSGTPANHNLLYIRVKDNGTARVIGGWDAIYRAGTDLPFPTTTTVSKTMYMVFSYNSLDSKWDLVDVVNGLSLVSNLLLSIVFGGLITFMEKKKTIFRIAACIGLLLLPFSTWTKVPFAGTRFYFDRLSTSPISPAINAGWTKTTVAAYCMAYAGKVRWGRSASGATQSSIVSGTTAPQKMVGPVYITQPLAAQTILSGATFTFQIRCIKSATASTGNAWVYVRLCDNDGTNITEIGNCTNTANALTTTATDRNLVLTLGGNITVAGNQRIIFEIGENFTTGTTSHTFGFNSSLGPGTADHTLGDNTETAAFNSWCECSQTLTMAKIGNF